METLIFIIVLIIVSGFAFIIGKAIGREEGIQIAQDIAMDDQYFEQKTKEAIERNSSEIANMAIEALDEFVDIPAMVRQAVRVNIFKKITESIDK